MIQREDPPTPLIDPYRMQHLFSLVFFYFSFFSFFYYILFSLERKYDKDSASVLSNLYIPLLPQFVSPSPFCPLLPSSSPDFFFSFSIVLLVNT